MIHLKTHVLWTLVHSKSYFSMCALFSNELKVALNVVKLFDNVGEYT